MEEIWEPILEYNNLYSVSNMGRIRRNAVAINRISRKGLSYTSIFKANFLKLFLNKDGYLYVGLCINGKSKQHKIHRLVALYFCENPDNKLHIDHIDGNKQNNVYSNLRWCTHAENIRFAWENGLYNNIGSKHGRSKLTEDKVKLIKEDISKGHKNYIIAKKFGVRQQNICDIRKGRLWKHV